MIIVFNTNNKNIEKKYRCCICFERFQIGKVAYGNKNYVDDFHVCRDCAFSKCVRDKIDEMVDYYTTDLKRKPKIWHRIIAFFDNDSFSYLVVKAWMVAHRWAEDSINRAKAERRRQDFGTND